MSGAWRRAGCPCETEGGSGRPSLYNTAAVIRWREMLAAGETIDVDLTEGKRRKMAAEAALKEIELETARGELLPRGEVHVAVTASFARVRAKLLALPTKLAPLVVGATGLAVIREKIADGINEALAELASTRIAGVPADEDAGDAR